MYDISNFLVSVESSFADEAIFLWFQRSQDIACNLAIPTRLFLLLLLTKEMNEPQAISVIVTYTKAGIFYNKKSSFFKKNRTSGRIYSA